MKLLLKALLNGTKVKTRERVSEEQGGLKEDNGCGTAVFILRMISERCVIDYEKASDSVKHEEFLKCMGSMALDGKQIRIFHYLYCNQEAAMRAEGKIEKFIQILK